jgi:hypothetical protein
MRPPPFAPFVLGSTLSMQCGLAAARSRTLIRAFIHRENLADWSQSTLLMGVRREPEGASVMSRARTAFAVPIATTGLVGFPAVVSTIGEARELIELLRLPAIRSSYTWLDAYNRLTLAQAAPTVQHIEAARISLSFAVLHEQRGGRRVRRDRHPDVALAA